MPETGNHEWKGRQAFSMRSTLELVLREATHHRLHPAMMLVAKERLNPHHVLALQWRFVDLHHARIGYPVYASISERISESLRWHKSRLRLETLNADQVWDDRSFVITKPGGSRYTMAEADCQVSELFHKFGIDSIGTLSSLRHPIFV